LPPHSKVNEMRAYIPDYNLLTPGTLVDALNLLAREPEVWRPFAGGTDLMVLLEAGKLPHKNYLNIWNLRELRGIEVDDTKVMIGALATYTEIQANAVLRTEFPMLCQAASETGGLAIQNRGTLGGNIVNASPAADSPPALLAYDAELELVSTGGSRRLAYRDFHTGYKQMNIRPEELLIRICLPRSGEKLKHYYRKVGTRKAQAISKVCFAAVALSIGGKIEDLRIALGSVAPIPLRCIKTEAIMRGKTIDETSVKDGSAELGREITPISDIRSTRDYRLRIAQNLFEDFLGSLA
ncbi:MAG: FAD binding domain-containing protein, partial [Pyrinomonadaceae bacterium]